MTTRKPKLNLLYADTSMPRLQLAVVKTEPNASPATRPPLAERALRRLLAAGRAARAAALLQALKPHSATIHASARRDRAIPI